MSRPVGRALNPVAWLAAGLSLLALPWIAFKPNRLLDGAFVRSWGLEPALAAALALALPAAVLVAVLAGSFSPLAPVVDRQQFGLETRQRLAMAASAGC